MAILAISNSNRFTFDICFTFCYTLLMSITISSKNQIVIPKNVRTKMNISGGDILIVEKITKDHVILKKAPLAQDLIGIVSKVDSNPVKRTRTIRETWR